MLQTLVICSALSLAAGACADDFSTNAVPPLISTFQVSVHKGELVGSEQIQRVMITSGPRQYLLVLPSGLKVDATKPNKILFYSADESFLLIFRITGIAADANSDFFRKSLQEQYPGAKITEESSMRTADHDGSAFDLLWLPPGVSERFVRVAFIPSAVGILEFSLIAGSKDTAEAQSAFRGLVRGFRSNENGKIKIIQSSGSS